jgi:hypothetical protein
MVIDYVDDFLRALQIDRDDTITMNDRTTTVNVNIINRLKYLQLVVLGQEQVESLMPCVIKRTEAPYGTNRLMVFVSESKQFT